MVAKTLTESQDNTFVFYFKEKNGKIAANKAITDTIINEIKQSQKTMAVQIESLSSTILGHRKYFKNITTMVQEIGKSLRELKNIISNIGLKVSYD